MLVEGPPGIGKTTFAMEYLVKGAWYYGEPGLYVSFEELPEQLYRDMARFDWGITDLEKRGDSDLLVPLQTVLSLNY